MNTKYQEYSNEYINDIIRLFVKVFNSEPWNEKWSSMNAKIKINELISMPNAIILIAINSNRVIAFLAGNYETFHDGKSFFLKEILVDNTFQQNHIGTNLLSELENKLLQLSIKSIYLITSKDSVAEKFYYKNNYFQSKNGCILKKDLV